MIVNRFRGLILVFCLVWLPLPAGAEESVASATPLDQQYHNEDGRYVITLHTLMQLSNITVDGVKVSELSGLAWDDDDGRLYALSDNGFVLHLRPEFENNQLTDMHVLSGYPLRDQSGKPLRYKPSDSEDLTLLNDHNGVPGDTRLVVCFERIPRLIEYRTDGRETANITLPAPLADIKNYRRENQSLEAVTKHEQYGIITGPEMPLTGHPEGMLQLFSTHGQQWSFPAQDTYYGALVAMTTMPDGSLLALERAFGGLFPTVEISLHRVMLEEQHAKSELIYTFKPDNGILNDNFEGITRYRDNSYFMISDDNNHPLKRTILVYFSITEKTR